LSDIPITLACGLYDHMEALSRGYIQPTGIDVTFIGIDSPPEIFARMIKTNAFDISEMSLSSYFTLRARGNFPFIAIPVFPCRVFRHGYIFVNDKTGICRPKDLEGKIIGVQQYRQTAATWIRGILEKEYGVNFSNVSWVEGGVNVYRMPDQDMDLLPKQQIKIEPTPYGVSINDLLKSGTIAAYLGARIPACFHTHTNVVRLFPNYREIERAYYRKTGIFPIMHTLVIREKLHKEKPWIAENMFQAFEESKRWALQKMRFSGTTRYMVPWLNHELEEVDDMFLDGDPYPHGLEPNREVLETMVQFLIDQGFVENLGIAIDDLFVPIVAWAE